jgi:hypothetical protein
LEPFIVVAEGIVGCEPAHTAEGIGLSAPVAHVVDDALKLILAIIHLAGGAEGSMCSTQEVRGTCMNMGYAKGLWTRCGTGRVAAG